MRLHLLFVLLAPAAAAQTQLLESLRPDTLRGHISFLAADALEGRDAPSKGLIVADEYFAAQFRRFGLEPLINQSYFQPVPLIRVSQQPETLQLKLDFPGEQPWLCPPASASILASSALRLVNQATIKHSAKTTLPTPESIAGKVVLLHMGPMDREAFDTIRKLRDLGPAIIIANGAIPFRGPQLHIAGAPAEAPVLLSFDPALVTFLARLPDGPTPARITLSLPAPLEESVTVRNVLARLPGSDPSLKDQVILLSAHHDHLGIAARGEGDRILNGANDDASGIAALLALAEAFAAAPVRPRRSLVFAAFTAEEKGLLGSQYYAAHPAVPIRNTVANLNFEQLGRTDDYEEARIRKLTGTGLDYTTLTPVLRDAGIATGIEIWKHERNSNLFFTFADNYSLAKVGVPAITLSAAFNYSDYHRPTDHWEKIDYVNMHAVVGTIALTVHRLANQSEAPQWVPGFPETEALRALR